LTNPTQKKISLTYKNF